MITVGFPVMMSFSLKTFALKRKRERKREKEKERERERVGVCEKERKTKRDRERDIKESAKKHQYGQEHSLYLLPKRSLKQPHQKVLLTGVLSIVQYCEDHVLHELVRSAGGHLKDQLGKVAGVGLQQVEQVLVGLGKEGGVWLTSGCLLAINHARYRIRRIFYKTYF